MKRITIAAVFLTLAWTTVAAQKSGRLTIQSDTPVAIKILDANLAVIRESEDKVSTLTLDLPTGWYGVGFTLPDATIKERLVYLKKNCTTNLDLSYRPPTIVMQAPPFIPAPPIIVETPKPGPEFEFKPESVPTRFDQCCGCKRDDLKARLDLFAIELHRNPRARGRIVAGTQEALLYLINQRRVDRARLELQGAETNCVEVWILP